MKQVGLVDISEEQSRLLAERLASILKKDPKEMKKELQSIFDLEIVYDLEEQVLSFVVSFTVILNYGKYMDLGERIDLLEEALGEMDECMRSGGSQLGSVLASWPRGRKLLEDARSHLQVARLTSSVSEPFWNNVSALAGAIDKLKAELCSDSVGAVVNVLGKVYKSFAKDLGRSICN